LQAGRKLSAILETLPIGVIIADAKGRITQANEAVLRVWRSVEPFKNDSYGEFLEWWDHSGQTLKDAIQRALSGGASTQSEMIGIKCFDETSKTILNSVSPLRGHDDQIVGAVAVIQDVTEHKKIEEDMEQRILKLISRTDLPSLMSVEPSPPPTAV
jgi:PAS domain-containing protein